MSRSVQSQLPKVILPYTDATVEFDITSPSANAETNDQLVDAVLDLLKTEILPQLRKQSSSRVTQSITQAPTIYTSKGRLRIWMRLVTNRLFTEVELHTLLAQALGKSGKLTEVLLGTEQTPATASTAPMHVVTESIGHTRSQRHALDYGPPRDVTVELDLRGPNYRRRQLT